MLISTKIAKTFVVLLWFALPSAGYSQEIPSASSDKQGDAPQQGTWENPFIIKAIPEKRPQHEIDDEKAETHRKAIFDNNLLKLTSDLADYTKLLFYATGALAVVTLALAVAGFCQSREARETTRIANRNLQLIPDIERAYVTGGGMRIKGDRFQIHVGNYGKTPADLLYVDYNFLSRDVPLPAARKSDEVIYKYRFHFRDSFAPMMHKALSPAVEIDLDINNPVICGRIYYTDIWKTAHSSGFLLHIPDVGSAPFETTEDQKGYEEWN